MTLKPSATVRIDLTEGTLADSAPDSGLTYTLTGYSSPPGAADGPNYAVEQYPFPTLSGYNSLSQPTIGESDGEGSVPPVTPAVLDDVFNLDTNSYRLYHMIVPTSLPLINNSGENRGLMSQESFKFSWIKNIYEFNAAGVDRNSGVISSVEGWYGNWPLIDSYYLSGEILSSPYYFPFITLSTFAESRPASGLTLGSGADPVDEVLYIINFYRNSPQDMDGCITAEDGRTTVENGYKGIYDDATLTTEQRDSSSWPYMVRNALSTLHSERDFRSQHIYMNMSFASVPGVHRDLYERYFHYTYNNQRRDQFITNRTQALAKLFKMTSELPKEYRVRMQPQSRLQTSQLAALPMSEADTADTTATTPSTTVMSVGSSTSTTGY